MSVTMNPAVTIAAIVAVAAVAIVALIYGRKLKLGVTEKGIEIETDSGHGSA